MTVPYYTDQWTTIHHGNALALPVADNTIDLVVTSPPYFGLRSYQDGGEHYDGQLGSEATPTAFVDALLAATREMVRVLKPEGSIFVNLGDKYAQAEERSRNGEGARRDPGNVAASYLGETVTLGRRDNGVPRKSLIGIPWRYALRCIDELGLILRAEVIWDKPNGLPESVQDRVRRSHEQWFHFVTQPRYFSAVDEIREPSAYASEYERRGYATPHHARRPNNGAERSTLGEKYAMGFNPLGKLPGSVWTIPTQPLTVPTHLGVDHFAAFPMEWPRRIIKAWSPSGVCTECGQGRRPVIDHRTNSSAWSGLPLKPKDVGRLLAQGENEDSAKRHAKESAGLSRPGWRKNRPAPDTITGYECACPHPTAPTTPALVLDPFGGTGTTALVAKALGRRGITVDLSADYCRLAQWRCTDPGEQARARQVDKPAAQVTGQDLLFQIEDTP